MSISAPETQPEIASSTPEAPNRVLDSAPQCAVERTLRVFLSSPGDVGQERLIATRVMERINGEFAGCIRLEPILWEHEPLRATGHFQEQIIPPSQTDIVICILWSRLGTRLPSQFHREDGSLFSSGTEWEFEDAARAFRERGAPDLMVYRKTSEAFTPLSNEQALLDRLAQKKALEAFIDHWFGNPQASFKAAFHGFSSPDQFEEMLENHLRRLVEERLPRHMTGEESAAPISWHRGSPFRGLAVFEPEHAPVFFGRTHAIGEIRDILVRRASENCAFTLVFGRSGSGKSSLVRAGVLPTITQPGVIEHIGLWRWSILRAADAISSDANRVLESGETNDLIAGLAASLLDKSALPELRKDGLDERELAALLRQAPERAVAPIRAALKRAAEDTGKREGLDSPPEARFFLVLDQLEELWTLEKIGDNARRSFIEAIAALARSGAVWVVATMRSDFYARCAEVPTLVALKEGSGSYDLLPPTFAEVGQMIRNPSRAAGLRFESDPKTGERLDERLHEAAWRDPEALPLLEFTLDELWQRRTPDNILTFAAYDELGGPEGALARRAEDVFSQLDEDARNALPSVLRCLVTVNDSSTRKQSDAAGMTGQRVPLETLCDTPPRRALVEAFVAARLLVTDCADDGRAVVGVAHEALLRRWPRVQNWLEENRDFLRARDRVAQSAARWKSENQNPDLLLPPGKPLAEAEDILLKRRDDLDANLVEYIESSHRKQSRARRIRRVTISSVAAGFFVLVTGFGVFSFGQWQRAEKQKNLALQAINIWTNTIPDQLKDVPGSLPVLKTIQDTNDQIVDKILRLNPDTPEAQREKALNFERSGSTAVVLGNDAQALQQFNKSFAIFQTLAQQRPSIQAQNDLAASYEKMGDLLVETNDAAGALNAYQKSLQIGLQLSRNGDDREAQRGLSVSYEKIGDAQFLGNQAAQALDSYQKSLAIRETLASNGNALSSTQSQRDLAVSLEKIGVLQLLGGKIGDAQNALGKSLDLRVRLLHQNPTPEAQRDLAIAWKNMGDLRLAQNKAKEALDFDARAAKILTDLSPFSSQARRDLAVIFNKMADVYVAQNDYARAIASYQQGVTTIAELVRSAANERDRTVNTQYLAQVYGALAWAQLLAHRPQDAVVSASRGLQTDASQRWIKVNLAHAYLLSGQNDKAEVLYLENRRVQISAGKTFAQTALDDFKAFRDKKLLSPAQDKEAARIAQLLTQNTL